MKKVSIVISSLRPAHLEQVIDSTQQYHDDVEVVVVSPFPPKPRDFVIHIPVPAVNQPGELTFVQKFNLGYKSALGEFIVFSNDDLLFNQGWLPGFLGFMEENKSARHPVLAAFCSLNNGEINKHRGAGCWAIFGFRYANCGGMSKEDFEKLGGVIFDENFCMYGSDVDLGLRVWNEGGEVKLCDKVILEDCNVEDKVHRRSLRIRWYAHDERVLFDKWFPKYGKPIRGRLLRSEIHQLLAFVNKPMEWYEITPDWHKQLLTLVSKSRRFSFLPNPDRIIWAWCLYILRFFPYPVRSTLTGWYITLNSKLSH